MKKIVAILMCAFLLISVLSACGKNEEESAPQSTDSGSLSVEDIVYNVDGESRYNVVRPDDCDSVITQAASKVFGSIKGLLGVSPKNTTDFDNGDDKYEILIGNTNRPESATALQMLKETVGSRYGDYIICSIGKKIVIIGMTDEATVAAADYFVSNYVKAEGVAGGINYTYATEGNFTTITIAGNVIEKYSIVRPHYNSSYITQIELEELQTYIRETSGYPIQIVEDRYVEAGEYEIIVGDTDRPAHRQFEEYDEYSIDIVGNKVYLDGGSNHAVALAVSEFNKMLESGSVTEANNVHADYWETASGYDQTVQYTPTWYDEFDGDTVDLDKWRFFGPGQSDSPGVNGKLSVRSNDPSVSYVKDGKFTIAASYDDNYYYGGMLRSNQNKTNYRYGYIEMSAIIPDGDGFWTTLWMCSEENNGAWSPEIDVNECYGNASKVEGNYHSWPTELGKEMSLEHFCGLSGDYPIPANDKDDEHFGLTFHTYGFMWTDEWIGGTVDGNLYQTHDITQDNNYIDTFNDSMYLIISMATYFENCPLTPNATEYEWENTNKLIVESVYIYQLRDGKHELNGVKLT